LAAKTLSCAKDAAELIRKILPDNSREHLVVLYLDGAHQTISYAVTATGAANVVAVHPREVFQRAVLVGAAALIISHNHPSGSVEASEQDRVLTYVLKKAGECLGIKILDHVIVTNDSHYSFAEMGEL
jgi:DNA repair protein RadC